MPRKTRPKKEQKGTRFLPCFARTTSGEPAAQGPEGRGGGSTVANQQGAVDRHP